MTQGRDYVDINLFDYFVQRSYRNSGQQDQRIG